MGKSNSKKKNQEEKQNDNKKEIEEIKKKFNIDTSSNSNHIEDIIDNNDNNDKDTDNDNDINNNIKIKINNNKEKNLEQLINPTFRKLLETLYSAGLTAQRKVQYHHLNRLNDYFEDNNNDGILEPRCVKILVPSKSDDPEEKWKVLEIPVFTLINHNNLKIDNMKINFNIDLGELSEKKFNNNHIENLTSSTGKKKHKVHKRKWRLNICRPITKQANTANVEVEFKYEPPVESLSRLNERYTNII